jgi:hypothetical protein
MFPSRTHLRSPARTPFPHAKPLIGQCLALAVLVFCLGLAVCPLLFGRSGQQAGASGTTGSDSAAPLPRGKKLMLKDGTFQLVKSYQLEGDRVRFYSIDQSDWEEIPAALVDWDATKKEEATEAKTDSEILAKASKIEAARRAAPTLDVDASLEVLPNVFLPPGAGAFVLEGRSLLALTQAETQERRDKKQTAKQILIPVPIVPSRRNIIIQGPRAHLRVTDARPEFWIRMFGSSIPNVELVRIRARGPVRVVENVDTLFTEQREVSTSLPLQEWPVAQRVFRYTLEQPLPPGEYALTQMTGVRGQDTDISLYVWDFGVDPGVGVATPTAAPKKK